MLKEFKKFALKGNVVDMAVGVIIGTAFGKIVTSLVNDIIMPLLGIVLGQINLKHLKLVIKPAEGDIAELAVLYGQFLQNVLDFLIIASSIFLVVKMLTSLKTRAEKLAKKEEEEKPQEPPKPSNEEVLLTEIRDLLKEQKTIEG
ncbi:MAG: large-conductance mechanosensitive channel protein MscL [Clostridiaceae bacterium]|jgi:large conductance mechanosensitive channel|nr:large-conductance mechanosensitive channel protein MscL [Clostridiaceae bacterium]